MDGKKLLAGLGLIGTFIGIGVVGYLNSRRRDGRSDMGMDDLPDEPEGRKAVEKFREVNWGKPADRVVRFPASKRKAPRWLVQVGDLEAVVYKSDKSGKAARYIHFFDDPNPMLTTTTNGKELFLIGGSALVDGRGIVG